MKTITTGVSEYEMILHWKRLAAYGFDLPVIRGEAVLEVMFTTPVNTKKIILEQVAGAVSTFFCARL